MATNWYYQIWIGSEYEGRFAGYYEYSGIPLSEAIDRAKRSYWDDGVDYPVREPNWNDPDEIDFYVSKVQRSQSEIQTIYTESCQKSLEQIVQEVG